MSLDTIGDRLKNARVERHLTLEQAAQATKIKEKYLEALENNRRELMPSAVQERGFLRLYAGFLDIPVQPLLEAWTNNGILIPPSAADENPSENLVSFNESEKEIHPIETVLSVQSENPIPHPSADQEVKVPLADRIFIEIGLELKRRREKLGLKLSDIERFTMVRQHYLDLLEQGKLEDLPSLVQARGMLNNYSRFLELDTDKIMLKYASALQQRRLELQSPLSSSKSSPLHSKKVAPWKKFITPDLVIGAFFTLSLLIFALLGISQITSSQTQPENPNDLIALPESILATPQLMLTSTPQQPEPTKNPEDNRPQDEDGPEPTVQVEPTEFVNLAPLQLNIVANQRAYLRIISDGKTVFNGRVVPGNAYSFSAKTQMELLTGNASAIQVFFNQQEIGVLGNVGQVASRIFTLTGVATPTAQFTPTPTETLPPTQTPMPSPTVMTPTVTPFIP